MGGCVVEEYTHRSGGGILRWRSGEVVRSRGAVGDVGRLEFGIPVSVLADACGCWTGTEIKYQNIWRTTSTNKNTMQVIHWNLVNLQDWDDFSIDKTLKDSFLLR